MIRWILILILLAINFPSFLSCPSKCVCNTNKVDCSQNQMSILPSMKKIPEGTIDLILNENNLTYINSTFKFSTLQSLDLSKNLITFIQVNAFFYLPALEFLDLSRNKLIKLSNVQFSQLSHLRTLNLSDNYFEQLPNTIFSNKLWLENLVLSNNFFKIIDVNWFVSLPRLRSLSISNVKAYTLDPIIFRHNQQLERIDISHNEFTDVPNKAFRILPLLKSLVLDSNPIRMLNYQSFEKLHSLEILTINRMSKLTSIKSLVFSDLHNLKRLEITYNPHLTYLDSESFFEIDVNLIRFPIEILLLNNNNLKTLSEITLPWCDVPKVDLRDNDWNCDCNLKWIKECKENKDFKSIKCSTPKLLSGIEIGVININEFKCKKTNAKYNKIVQINLLMFGVLIMFFVGLFIAIYLQRHHLIKWCRDRRKGPGPIYYVKVSKNLRNEDSI